MMVTEIGFDEFMAALEEAQHDDEGLTVEEITLQSGHCSRWIQQMIRKAQTTSGIKVIVGRKSARRIDGRTCQIPCYKFIREGASDDGNKTNP